MSSPARSETLKQLTFIRFSGACWSWSGDPTNVHVVTNWSTAGINLAHVKDDAKAPTAISYGESETYWGYGIPDDLPVIKWFKLLLLNSDDLDDDVRNSPYLKTAKRELKRAKKSVVEVVADYLRLLWEHTIATMKRERGNIGVDGLPFKVVLTVPAIWKPYAQSRMLKAAKLAGITDERLCGETILDLVSEPEAAALATLNEYRGRTDVEAGDVFVVCDVGGGTTDIISYKIQQSNPLQLRESVEGKGKLCGAIFVDERFQEMIQDRLASRWEKLTDRSKRRLMNNDWEFGIKRSFDADPSKVWTVQLPPEAIPRVGGVHRLSRRRGDLPILNGQVQITTAHVEELFTPIIDNIKQLVDEQRNRVLAKEGKLPKAIILVGGFGACNYLYDQLSSVHEPAGIAVLQAKRDGPWTAVARGSVVKAAFSGSSTIVRSRISRFSYGTDSNQYFIDGKHDPKDKFWCKYKDRWKARDQMTWYVKKVSRIPARNFLQNYKLMLNNNTREMT
jgi:hypothetical protein